VDPGRPVAAVHRIAGGRDRRCGVAYHARSWTLGGFDELELWIKDAVAADYPLYAAAPEEPGPSQTSWSSFWAKQLGEGALTWQEWREANGS
jgi:hypothetical protein